MEERKISAAYVNVLSVIKDQIANNVSEQAKKRGVDAETTRALIFAAQSTVDTVGINGFTTVFNAAKQAAEASNEKSSKR
jgi:hypothetical protein